MRLLRWPVRLLAALVLLALAYLLAAVAGGLIPVNEHSHGLEGTPGDEEELFIVSNGIHLEIVVAHDPGSALHQQIALAAGVAEPDYWAFGWGERDFFLETPTWADFDLWTAANSLLWQDDVLVRIRPIYGAPSGQDVRYLEVAADQLASVEGFVSESITRDAAGNIILVPSTLYDPGGIFVEGQGTYSPFYSCNEWVNDGLTQSGLPAAWWSPFPQGLLYQLK